MVDNLTSRVKKNSIGFFGLSYNVSYHGDILPNLATQIVMESGLENVEVNEEIPYYGCASSIYSMKQAVAYCNKYEKSAIVFAYDQSFCRSLMLDRSDPDLKKMMITNLLFADAGVGILIIPEKLRKLYNKPLLKIADIGTKYIPGNFIKMTQGKFLMSPNLKNLMPKLVANKLVKPFFKKNHIDKGDIDSWFIHQGGSEVIKQFCKKDVLDLEKSKITHSLKLFHKYANTSAASCVLVLEDYFNNPDINKKLGSKSLMIGFGAGYYLGTVLFEYN